MGSIKYHLGCGSNYLQGYVNVDFPPKDHNVNFNIKADLYTDILKMKLKKCDEIRSHHFFEHHNFYDTFVLLHNWAQALNKDGTLIIDVPDLEALCKAYLLADKNKKFLVKRYLFGSHEAHWAYHINGWCQDSLSTLMNDLGFQITNIHKYGDINEAQPNCGITLTFKKTENKSSQETQDVLIHYLSLYKNGDTEFENSLFEFFVKEFKSKI